jgi:hypothetical protein
MAHDETSYYLQRAVTHRAMALTAQRQDVRDIHEELARRYDAQAKAADLRADCVAAARQVNTPIAIA